MSSAEHSICNHRCTPERARILTSKPSRRAAPAADELKGPGSDPTARPVLGDVCRNDLFGIEDYNLLAAPRPDRPVRFLRSDTPDTMRRR